MIAASTPPTAGFVQLPTLAPSKAPPEGFKRLEPKSIDGALGGKVADNDPSNLYATITKNGEIIAKIYKSGLTYQPNQSSTTEELVSGVGGKELADARIAQLTRISGAEVSYSNSSTHSALGGGDAAKPSASASFLAQLLSSKW